MLQMLQASESNLWHSSDYGDVSQAREGEQAPVPVWVVSYRRERRPSSIGKCCKCCSRAWDIKAFNVSPPTYCSLPLSARASNICNIDVSSSPFSPACVDRAIRWWRHVRRHPAIIGAWRRRTGAVLGGSRTTIRVDGSGDWGRSWR